MQATWGQTLCNVIILATRPAKMIVDKIRPLTKKIDSAKDWEAIINDNIVPFLANPLTKQWKVCENIYTPYTNI